jgi:hypothetical protein
VRLAEAVRCVRSPNDAIASYTEATAPVSYRVVYDIHEACEVDDDERLI